MPNALELTLCMYDYNILLNTRFEILNINIYSFVFRTVQKF